MMMEVIGNRHAKSQTKFSIGSQEYTTEEWDRLLNKFDEAEKVIQEAIAKEGEKNLERAQEESIRNAYFQMGGRYLADRQPQVALDCPYGSLAVNGVIEYNGVIFGCDPEHNTITLGDVSDKKKVLNIALPSGGNLKVNVDNLEELSKAAGMFSPEDLNAILRAIEQYKHCQKKLDEIEAEEFEAVEDTKEDGDALPIDVEE